MSQLVMGTNAVSMDEPCWALREKIAQSPGNRGWRRYQLIAVMRPGFDEPVYFQRDLGRANKFKVSEFVIPGGVRDSNGRIEILHTVGELFDMAEYLRAGIRGVPDEPEQPSDLIQGYYDLPDKRRLERRKRSMSSRLVWVQRS